MYDVIILGARVAGSPTAMLLARKGYRVLLVDRATFPSDTMSTHQIQVPGGIALKRWGLLDAVMATGLAVAHHVQLDNDGIVVKGAFPTVEGVAGVYSPRRYLLDNILARAAVAAGAELREGFVVRDLLWEGGRVVGILGEGHNSASVSERARIVIGADGRHSLVAKVVKAAVYDEQPTLTCGYYSYWEGVSPLGGEIYSRGRRMGGAWPTNDSLTMIYVAWPASEFKTFRGDVEGNYLATVRQFFGERIDQGQRVERVVGSGEMPNFYRRPYGPGWALVGDAGYIKDPITGLGISDAFRDAELLANALDAGFAGRQPLETALASYARQRNAASKPAYALTLDTARLRPRTAVQMELLRALAHDPAAASQFFGVLTGVVKPDDFFTPRNMIRLVGVGGMIKAVSRQVFGAERQSAVVSQKA
ncbi:MAG TPA: NAD(P)/FAD-dependent oxidoreductase [Ktedonobacterales bacterium]|nr:NAD(P)/FAD-dependent oxidoreductase [Ktedonobacterales bacterium]